MTVHSSSRRHAGRRRLRLRLAAAVSAAAAAALLVALPQPGAAFLMPSSAAASLRRPREAASVSSSSSRLGATSLHNPEGAFTGSSSSSSSGRGKGELMGAADDDLQQALFKEDSRRVILFDGDCGFCSEGVNLFLNFDGDPRGSFRFASLQGEVGQELLRLNHMDQKVFNTIVLVESDRILIKSDAVLEIASKLREPFRGMATLAKLLPLETRDWAYEIVSRYRHIFGEKDSCRIPSESELERFLD